MNHKKEVTRNFQAALKTFETSQEWYYAVKADHDNPHSLASALCLTNEQLLEALICCGVAARLNEGRWKYTTKDTSVLGVHLGISDDCTNVFNFRKPPCLDNKSSKVLFIKLWTKETKASDWGDNVVLIPRLQQMKDTPPEVKAKRANQTACNRLSNSINQYCTSQSVARENATR